MYGKINIPLACDSNIWRQIKKSLVSKALTGYFSQVSGMYCRREEEEGQMVHLASGGAIASGGLTEGETLVDEFYLHEIGVRDVRLATEA